MRGLTVLFCGPRLRTGRSATFARSTGSRAKRATSTACGNKMAALPTTCCTAVEAVVLRCTHCARDSRTTTRRRTHGDALFVTMKTSVVVASSNLQLIFLFHCLRRNTAISSVCHPATPQLLVCNATMSSIVVMYTTHGPSHASRLALIFRLRTACRSPR